METMDPTADRDDEQATSAEKPSQYKDSDKKTEGDHRDALLKALQKLDKSFQSMKGSLGAVEDFFRDDFADTMRASVLEATQEQSRQQLRKGGAAASKPSRFVTGQDARSSRQGAYAEAERRAKARARMSPAEREQAKLDEQRRRRQQKERFTQSKGEEAVSAFAESEHGRLLESKDTKAYEAKLIEIREQAVAKAQTEFSELMDKADRRERRAKRHNLFMPSEMLEGLDELGQLSSQIADSFKDLKKLPGDVKDSFKDFGASAKKAFASVKGLFSKKSSKGEEVDDASRSDSLSAAADSGETGSTSEYTYTTIDQRSAHDTELHSPNLQDDPSDFLSDALDEGAFIALDVDAKASVSDILDDLKDVVASVTSEDVLVLAEIDPKHMERMGKAFGRLFKHLQDVSPEAGENIGGFLSNIYKPFADIPPEAFENLESGAKGFMLTAAGIAAIAGSLFLVALVPAEEAIVGLGVVAAAVTATYLAGTVATEVAKGAVSLVLMSGAMAIAAYAMHYVAEIPAGPALAGLGIITAAGAAAALAGVGLPFIAAGAGALLLMAPAYVAAAWGMEKVAAIPASDALEGLGIITQAIGVAVASLVAIPGLVVLPMLGGAFYLTALGIAKGTQLIAEVPDSAFANFERVMSSIAEFSQEIDPRDFAIATGVMPLFNAAIVGTAFSVAMLSDAGVSNFTAFIGALTDLISYDDVGGRLQAAAKGIEAINEAQGGFFDKLFGALADKAVELLRGENSPFDIYTELAAHGDIGSNLLSAAEGITAVNEALVSSSGESPLGSAVRDITDAAGDRLSSLIRGGGPFEIYYELAERGADLEAAGEGLKNLSFGIEYLVDVDTSELETVGDKLGDFLDSFTEDQLIRMQVFGQLDFGEAELGSEPAAHEYDILGSALSPAARELSVNDAIVQSDGTVIHLDPEDNVYATTNALEVYEKETFESYESYPQIDMPDFRPFLEDNVSTLSELTKAVTALKEQLRSLQAAQENQYKGPAVVQINPGYGNDSLLEANI